MEHIRNSVNAACTRIGAMLARCPETIKPAAVVGAGFEVLAMMSVCR
jgi:hypothetical protein